MNVVVTGSSTGIGRALCLRLLGHGHQVWGLARSAQIGLVELHGQQFRHSICDVSHWETVHKVSSEIATAWGHVDALVCAAAVQGEVGRALSADPKRWTDTVRIDLEGTYYALRALAPLLEKTTRRAKVVCFSGGGATKARPYFSAYGVAKTGVVRLVETIAEEEKNRPLDINAIAPGAINTRLTDEIIALGPDKAGESEYQAAVKQKSTGGASLEKALDCVEWLISEASDGISGRLISAPWDPWEKLGTKASDLARSELYTLRRINLTEHA